MRDDAPNFNHFQAGLIVEELLRNGVEWFCICPGSRSTPLAWAVASNPKAKYVVHYDERGAAFHALGIGKATRIPAVFICTSGTAVANAFPAVVEASMAHVPMILLTADRPQDLHDVGANQTIDQVKIFGGYVRWHGALERLSTGGKEAAVGGHACYRARFPNPGPVHLNVPYYEPLAPDVDELFVQLREGGLLDSLASWRDGDLPMVYDTNDVLLIGDNAIDIIAEHVQSAQRGLLFVGALNTPDERDAVQALASKLQWPLFADVTSGIRCRPVTNLCPFSQVRRYFNLAALDDTDYIVLHIGGTFTSRDTLDAMNTLKHGKTPVRYIQITPYPDRSDPFGNVTVRATGDIPSALVELEKRLDGTPAGHRWDDRIKDSLSSITDCIADIVADSAAPSEISVAHLITREAPAHGVLFLGNSMPIRDADRFGSFDGAGTWVTANRGASGIDGNIATAAGYARAWAKPTTAILGDLATLHDLNSLALLRDLPAPVILMVLNNNGGGIFHFLPIAEHKEHFETLFGTPHGMTFDRAAQMFGLPHHRPKTNAELLEIYRAALRLTTSCIIEIASDREENRRQHEEVARRIAEAFDND